MAFGSEVLLIVPTLKLQMGYQVHEHVNLTLGLGTLAIFHTVSLGVQWTMLKGAFRP